MPKILQQQEVKVEWADLERINFHHPWPEPYPRSKGTHLSDVLRKVALKSGILKPIDDEEDEEVMPLRMAVGTAWEEWAAGLYPGMSWQPGEQECDGVYGTPDGASFIHGTPKPNTIDTLVLEEFKATWKSERTHPILNEWLWLHQVMGYCKMLDTLWARLHVLWVNGDYRPPSPKYCTYLIEFTQAEIDRAWALVMRNK